MANPTPSISLAGLAALLLPLAAFLSFSTSLQAAQGARAGLDGGGRRLTGYVPARAVVYRSAALPLSSAATTTASADEAPGGGGGGGYEPFELCMGCRCCAAAASNNGSSSSSCVDTRCCYAIDCNIPGKPFGVCAFSPRTCGCGDNNCTAQ